MLSNLFKRVFRAKNKDQARLDHIKTTLSLLAEMHRETCQLEDTGQNQADLKSLRKTYSSLLSIRDILEKRLWIDWTID